MKGSLFLAALATVIIGCEKSELPKAAESKSPPAAVVAPPEIPVKRHNYAFKDGYEYGYERAPSVEEQQKGLAASSLVMAKYAGTRDGKYQAYIKLHDQPGAAVVLECTNPCEFMKVMTFFEGEFVSTERMRVAPGIIGWMILQDAINGELDQYVADKNGRKMTVWFDEKKGVSTTAVPGSELVKKSK